MDTAVIKNNIKTDTLSSQLGGPTNPVGSKPARGGTGMKWEDMYANRTRRMKRSAIRELLKVTRRPEVISFAGGLPAAELFPLPEVKNAVSAVLDKLGGKSLQYGETE